VVADIAKLSVGRRSTRPASWPPTTSSTCPATARVQGGGTAPAPPAWGWRAKHRWPGSRPCSKAGTPPLATCSAGPTAATPCLALMSSCGRPRASRSSTAWVTRPRPGGVGCPPRRCPRGGRLPGRASWGPPRPRRCPARVRTGVVGGRVRPPHVPRGRSTAAHPSGHRQPGPGAGRPWTDGMSIGIGWRQTPSTGARTSGRCPGRSGGVDASGPPRQPGAPGHARGAGPELSKRTG
jgi:hypothetical protein